MEGPDQVRYGVEHDEIVANGASQRHQYLKIFLGRLG
jgi:hypothetical protein